MNDLISNLGYEQIRALQILRDTPDIEGSALCKQADCSFDELFKLGTAGLLDLGMGRVSANQVHPRLTETGHRALEQAAAAGL
jgi:hypothetical protein